MRYHPCGADRYTSGSTPTSFKYTGQRQEAGIGLYYYADHYTYPLPPFLLSRYVVGDVDCRKGEPLAKTVARIGAGSNKKGARDNCLQRL